MKKMPRKFSQGGEMQPKEQAKSAEPKKPADNMPDWAKKAREEQKADMATDKGYKAATAKDRLAPKGFKKGGSIKKFSAGNAVEAGIEDEGSTSDQMRFAKSDPDIYKRAYAQARSESKEPSEAPKAKSAAPKKSEAAAEPKSVAPKSAAPKSAAPKSEAKKDDYSNEGRNAPAPKPRSNPRFAEPERDVSKMSDMDRYFANRAKTTDTSRVLPPPLTESAGPTAMERARSERLQRDADARLRALNEARREAGKSKGFEENFPDTRSASERSMDRGERLKRAVRGLFGLKDEYKSGGKVAKYAKGGGVESKGKTKGTVVKMAKGGSVKGWGISRGAKACKMV